MIKDLIRILPIIIVISGCAEDISSLNGGGGIFNPGNPVNIPTQINWTPPTLNSDGSLFTDLSKYRLYYGPDQGSLSAVLDIDSAGVAITSYVFSTVDQETLASLLSSNSTHVFAMTAINSQNIESSFSNTAIF